MNILNVVLILAAVGILLYLINQIEQIDVKIKKVINIVVYIAVVIWLLRVFGIWGYLSQFKV